MLFFTDQFESVLALHPVCELLPTLGHAHFGRLALRTPLVVTLVPGNNGTHLYVF